VLETAEQSVRTARAILQLFKDDCYQIRTLNRQAAAALLVHQYLQNRPRTSIQSAGAARCFTLPTVTSALTNLVKLGIVQEMTGQHRNRLFRYSAYLKILPEGAELLR
jgi:Fic family protein